MVDLELPAGGARSDWSPTNDLVARSNTVEQEHQVQIIDANSGEIKLTIPAHDLDERLIRQVEFSPSGRALLTSSANGIARVWKVEDGTLLTEVANDAGFYWAAWSPEGTKFATGTSNRTSDTGVVQIWDAQTGEELFAFDEHFVIVRGLAWSPDGGRIASTSDAGDLLIWDPATGEIFLDLIPDDLNLRVGNPAWSADGARLAAYRNDGVLYIWDSTTGELLQSITGHSGFARWLSWFPLGDRLLASDGDNDLKLWDVESGAELLSITLSPSEAGLSSDARKFLAWDDDSQAIFDIWGSLDELVALAKECCVIRELTPEERVQFGLDESEIPAGD
jgi:WD40 repeat protein